MTGTKSFVGVILILLLLLLVVDHTVCSTAFHQTNLSTESEKQDQGQDICDFCECRKLVNGYFNVTCEGLDLQEMYSEEDWQATKIFHRSTYSHWQFGRLYFSNNKLVRIPRFPKTGVSIISLSLRNNSIVLIEPGAFASLIGLEELNLRSNNLTGDALIGVFTGRNGSSSLFLHTLNLSKNRIQSLPLGVFDGVSNLRSLDLSYNPLKTLSGNTQIAISSMASLEILNLAGTGIDEIPDGFFDQMTHTLMMLMLDNNNFTEIPSELRRCHKLKYLYLAANKFESLDNQSFAGLEELELLDLERNRNLAEVKDGTFTILPNLDVLQLGYCKLHPNTVALIRNELTEMRKRKQEEKSMFSGENEENYFDFATTPEFLIIIGITIGVILVAVVVTCFVIIRRRRFRMEYGVRESG